MKWSKWKGSLDRPDVLVVGSGAAGTAAALEAAGAGARVLVLEAWDVPGGAAAASGGACCIVDSPLQAEVGIRDNIELAFQDWLTWGGIAADATWARRYLEASSTDIYGWLSDLGIVFHGVVQREGNSVPRLHLPEGGGEAMMRRLHRHSRTLGVLGVLEAQVENLLIEDGRVCGAKVDVSGKQQEVLASRIVIATGGFCSNATMIEELAGMDDKDVLLGGAPQSRGVGHQLLEEVGASFKHLDSVFCYPTGTPDPDGTSNRGLAFGGTSSDIWINSDGRRFHNENDRGGYLGLRAVREQRGCYFFSVFDSSAAHKFIVGDPRYRKDFVPDRDRINAFLESSPAVTMEATLPELATSLGIPQRSFMATVNLWNSWVSDHFHFDPHFGRPLEAVEPIGSPPFFAVLARPIARKNLGGVLTDEQCRVVSGKGVIRGLFAAGEVAGMAGGHINGDGALEGTMLGPSLYSGRIAGQRAVGTVTGTQ